MAGSGETHGDAGEGLSAGEGWRWAAGHDGPRTFHKRFRAVDGSLDARELRNVHDPDEGDVLALERDGGKLLLTGGPSLGSVQIDAALNRSAFRGAVGLLHHVTGGTGYGFLSLGGDGSLKLGEATPSGIDVQDNGSYDPDGWVAVRLVADRTHFRGYVNGEMIVHGHGPEPAEGPAGLLLEGSGDVLLKSFTVTRLR